MAAHQETNQKYKEDGAVCRVRLAPLIITHTVLLVVAVIWLIAILSG